MEKIKAVIVDDSLFSINIISDILSENNIEIVGTASSLKEVKEVVESVRPTLVTMDMTMPGTDGLECTRAIHQIDKDIKVIIISSMMDDEIVEQARKNRVSAYVQKPIDPDELITTISRVMASEELFAYLIKEHFAVFKEALMDGMNKMTKNLLTYADDDSSHPAYESKGVDIIIGIIGKFSGRMLLGLSKETAMNLTEAALRRPARNDEELIAMLAEFANIISGNACSILNRKNKALGLRVAPPSILLGEKIYISSANFPTTTAVAEAACGKILLNVGFTKRGDESWT